MSSPAPRARRPSLSSTVLRLAAVALLAAVLLWSVMFVNVLNKHANARAAVAPPTGQPPGSQGGQSAQARAPVTTRTS
jgi:hypothetical protein